MGQNNSAQAGGRVIFLEVFR